MKCSIYARESSDDTTKAPSIQEQIDRGKQYAQENNYEVVEVYSDNGYSGGDWKRPAWNQSVKDGKAHRYQILITWNQDRIARDTEQFLWYYRNMKEAHIKVISITEGEILLDSVGGVAKHISLAMASEIYRKVTSDKVKKAYAMKKAKAESKGEKVVWGRKHTDKLPDIEMLKHYRLQGYGYKQLASMYGNKVSYQTIRRALQKSLPENERIAKENMKKIKNRMKEKEDLQNKTKE